MYVCALQGRPLRDLIVCTLLCSWNDGSVDSSKPDNPYALGAHQFPQLVAFLQQIGQLIKHEGGV